MEIKIKLHEGGVLPKVISIGNWIDLCSAENVFFNKGEYKIISLGISMSIPEGYEAHLLPRSSTHKKWGLIMANSTGIIDNSYCGDNDVWGFSALAMRETVVNQGDRICQFRIMKIQPNITFAVVDSLGNNNRGGFGTTGHSYYHVME